MCLAYILFSVNSAQAAEVRAYSDPDKLGDLKFIYVTGDIVSGDANEFLRVALQADKAIVILESPGGDAREGLLLGRIIRKSHYSTAVIGKSQCYSACALMWIGGVRKFLSKDAVVGFHSVYSKAGISSWGNAQFGAFYGSLGLSDRAIEYLTSAPPEGFNPVTVENGVQLDIPVEPWEKLTGDTTDHTSSMMMPIAATQKPDADGFLHGDGISLFGFDLSPPSRVTATLAACQDVCKATGQCKAYSFDNKTDFCQLKSDGMLYMKAENASSGIRQDLAKKLKPTPLTALEGAMAQGISYKIQKSITAEQCLSQCDADVKCRSYNYITKDKTCDLNQDFNRYLSKLGSLAGAKY